MLQDIGRCAAQIFSKAKTPSTDTSSVRSCSLAVLVPLLRQHKLL